MLLLIHQQLFRLPHYFKSKLICRTHRRKELVKFLIDAGADVNIQANDGCKALDLALVIVMSESFYIFSCILFLKSRTRLLKIFCQCFAQETPKNRI